MRRSTLPSILTAVLLATQPLCGQVTRPQPVSRSGPGAAVPTLPATQAPRVQRPAVLPVTDAGVLQVRRDSLLGLLGLTRAQLSAPIRLTPGRAVVPFRGWLIFAGATLVAGAQDAYGPAYATLRSSPENSWEAPGVLLHLETEAGARYLVECELAWSELVFVGQGSHHTQFFNTTPAFIVEGGATNGHAVVNIRAYSLAPHPPVFYGCDISKLP
jgi:hypothetical protein